MNYRRPCPCGYGWLLTSEDKACAICTEAKLHKRTHVNDHVPHETMHDSWFEEGRVMRPCEVCGKVKYFAKAGKPTSRCAACRKKAIREKNKVRPPRTDRPAPKPKEKKTHCPQGHSFEEHGYTTPNGYTTCRVCTRESQRRMYAGQAGIREEAQALKPKPEPKPTLCKNKLHDMTDHLNQKDGTMVCLPCHRAKYLREGAKARAKKKNLTPSGEERE